MSFGVVLDVALGLAFIFALLALIASAVQEIIASVISMRGRVLQSMLVQLLSNDSSQMTASPALLGQWLRQLVSTEPPAPVANPPPPPPPHVLAAIPAPPAGAKTLAEKVLNHSLVGGAATYNLPVWLSQLIGSKKLPSYISSENFTTALVEALRDGHDDTLAVGSQISRAVALLPDNSPVKQALQGFIVEAKGDLDAFRARVQKWYDDTMDRAGGVYKRYAQYMLLVIGLVLAVVINADTIAISSTLWSDKNAREVVAKAATEYIEKHGQRDASSPPAANPPATEKGKSQLDPGINAALKQIGDTSQVLDQLPVPLGWPLNADKEIWKTYGWCACLKYCWDHLTVTKLLGMLLTGFAVSLGAPFWFDMLQNIANLRGAGRKPARADGTPQK